MTTYKVVRMYALPTEPHRTLRQGLTLEQAKAHCRNPETSSRTCTGEVALAHTQAHGPWFDGYDVDEPRPLPASMWDADRGDSLSDARERAERRAEWKLDRGNSPDGREE